MELYIETLTGTAFELRVSPFETVMSVKAKIARLEGIPISQQHLIWQSIELEDDYCLQDYSIHDGATLKLVLAMRGGPINTRRVPMEDPELRQISEYIASEASQDDLVEKTSGGGGGRGQVTLVVFREGDQLNFFRVVDKGDGNYSPLSESLSGGSMYNLCDDEEEEEVPAKDRVVENDKTKEKMKLLKLKMENLTISKKPKKKHVPRPPSTGRPGSKVRLRRLPSSGSSKSRHISLNKNPCLPPVGHSKVESTRETVHNFVEEDKLPKSSLTSNTKPRTPVTSVPKTLMTPSSKSSSATAQMSMDLPNGLQAVAETSESDLLQSSGSGPNHITNSESTSDKDSPADNLTDTDNENTDISAKNKEGDKDMDLATYSTPRRDNKPASLSHKRDLGFAALKESLRKPTSPTGRKDHISDKHSNPTSSKKEVTFEAVLGHTGPSKYATPDRKREFTLESLSQSEARAVSGMLRQASIERLGSSRLSSFIRSANKSRAGFTLGSNVGSGRISTPEGRLVSARLQKLSAGHDDRVMSPSHRLPPVKPKKKSKKCFVCGKKTGLATSYLCRCGNNFCATHRYAEAHSCTFDYKTEGRKLLEQSNPVVSAPKLPKI